MSPFAPPEIHKAVTLRRQLALGTAIGRTANELRFINLVSGADIKISLPDRLEFSDDLNTTFLRVIAELDESYRADLLDELGEAVTFTERPLPLRAIPSAGPLQAISLASVLAGAYFDRQILSRPTLIHRAEEILVLPSGLATIPGRHALRLFVAGIEPFALRSCYAFGAMTGIRSVVGDEAMMPHLLAAFGGVHASNSRPSVWSPTVGNATAILGVGPGRLHPAQSFWREKFNLSASITLHRVGTSVATPDLRFCDQEASLWGWGHAWTAGTAKKKAIGEAVERFAMGTVRPTSLTRARAVDLDGPFLDPDTIISYTSQQLSRHPELRSFRADEERFWVQGTRGGTLIYVLADLVFNPFVPPSRDKRLHCIANSSGVASASQASTAKERALLECIERDAFLQYWYQHKSPMRVDIKSMPLRARLLAQTIETNGWKVTVVDISTTTPVVAAIAQRPNGLVVGCAAGRGAQVVSKALMELTICIRGMPPRRPMRAQNVRIPEDHVMHYRQHGIVGGADFLTASPKVRPLRDVLRSTEVKIPPTAVFVRLPNQGADGKHVWRCLCPGLIPLTFGWDLDPMALPAVVAAMSRRSSEQAHEPLPPHPFG